MLLFVSRLSSASLFVLEHGAHGKRSCLWKSFYKSGQDLSVNLSDYVNDAGSILLFPLVEGNDINLVTTVFPVIENIDIHLKTYVFRKIDLEYPVFAHPTLVLKKRL